MTLSNWAAAMALVVHAGAANAEHAEAAHPWSYEGEHGPKHWGQLKPEYAACKTGKRQSPIDLGGAKTANLPAIDFAYAPVSWRIIDNGHTVQVNVGPGSSITVEGKRFDLVQFHFHQPSEERIEGRAYAMVTHLVHKSADDKLAVVAVLMKAGPQNPLIEELWRSMPEDVGQEHEVAGALDLRKLLPAQRGYYRFTGSLTTPPCSEDVTWLVLKTPVQISQAEQASFAARHAHNARPVQPLNGRTVEVSR